MSRWQNALFLLVLCAPTSAFANWSLNIGYHNPLHAGLGLNFLRLSGKWGFEVGIGSGRLETTDTDRKRDDDDDDTALAALAGEVDLKYFFSSGGVKPYLQGGFGAGLAAALGKETGASAGVGGGFVGLGLFFGSPSVYAYLSANAHGGDDLIFQGGIGFDI